MRTPDFETYAKALEALRCANWSRPRAARKLRISYSLLGQRVIRLQKMGILNRNLLSDDRSSTPKPKMTVKRAKEGLAKLERKAKRSKHERA